MNNLHSIAQAVQSQGRGKDTQLVHMTPNEVQGLHALAKAHGGSLSVNPSTGLPEAGFLDSLMPMLLGAGAMMIPGMQGVGAGWIGAGMGALQYARTGSLEKGLMAGLGAYGGAGLGASLMGAGATAGSGLTAGFTPGVAGGTAANTAADFAAEKAFQEAAVNSAKDVATRTAATEAVKNAGTNLATQQAQTAAGNSFGQNFSNMGTGLQNAFSDPSKFMQAYGGSGKNLAKYGGAAFSGPLMNEMAPKDTGPIKLDNEQYQYTYNPNRASEEDLAAQRLANPHGELKYFNPTYGPRQTVRVAQGGILGLVEGGVPNDYEYDPVSQTYKKVVQAPTGAVAPIGITSGITSGSDSPIGLTQEQKDFFDKETPAARDARMGKINDIITAVVPGALAMKAIESLFSNNTAQTVDQTQAQGYMDAQGLGPESGFSGSEAGGGGFGPSTAGEMAQGGFIRLAEGGTIDLSGTINIGGQGQQGALGGLTVDQTQAQGYMPKFMRPNNSFTGTALSDSPAQGSFPASATFGGLSSLFKDSPTTDDYRRTDKYRSMDGTTGSMEHVIPPADWVQFGGYQTDGNAQTKPSMYATGGMAKGGFVVPADVVSALGNGSTDAGLRALKVKLGAIKHIKGKGDGLSDSIPTSIDGKQPARVADGEAYIDPGTVTKIGGGDAKKGAKKLYTMMDKIRKQAHGKTTQQRKVNAEIV